MTTLETLLWDTPLSNWLLGLAAALLTWLVFSLVRKLVLKKTRQAGREDGLLHQMSLSLRQISIILLGLAVMSLFLKLPEGAVRVLRVIFTFGIAMQAAFWLTAIIDHWVEIKLAALKENDLTSRGSWHAMRIFLKVLVWLGVLLIVVDNLPNFNLSNMIASLGLGGIAIGLAAQNVIRDLLSSLTILLDKPFKVGDSIKAGELSGTVEKIGLRSTRVRNISGEEATVSNTDLLGSKLYNYTQMERRRVAFNLQFDYHTDTDQINQIPSMLETVINSVENVRFSRAHLQSLSPSALVFEVVYIVNSPDYNTFVKAQHEINLGILIKIKEAGIPHSAIPQIVVQA